MQLLCAAVPRCPRPATSRRVSVHIRMSDAADSSDDDGPATLHDIALAGGETKVYLELIARAAYEHVERTARVVASQAEDDVLISSSDPKKKANAYAKIINKECEAIVFKGTQASGIVDEIVNDFGIGRIEQDDEAMPVHRATFDLLAGACHAFLCAEIASATAEEAVGCYYKDICETESEHGVCHSYGGKHKSWASISNSFLEPKVKEAVLEDFLECACAEYAKTISKNIVLTMGDSDEEQEEEEDEEEEQEEQEEEDEEEEEDDEDEESEEGEESEESDGTEESEEEAEAEEGVEEAGEEEASSRKRARGCDL